MVDADDHELPVSASAAPLRPEEAEELRALLPALRRFGLLADVSASSASALFVETSSQISPATQCTIATTTSGHRSPAGIGVRGGFDDDNVDEQSISGCGEADGKAGSSGSNRGAETVRLSDDTSSSALFVEASSRISPTTQCALPAPTSGHRSPADITGIGVRGGVDDDSVDEQSVSGKAGSSGGKRGAETVRLSDDTYSLMYTSPPCTVAFAFSVLVFLFQTAILSLLLVDIIDLQDSTHLNPLQIPAGVSNVVRASQFLAIMIAVATQDDLITAINTFHIGYYRGVRSTEDGGRGRRQWCGGKGASRWQWIVALVLRASEGGLCLVVTFVLIMKENNVVDMMTNFLAVTFVSSLDDVTFLLAREGYFSAAVKRQCQEAMRVRIPHPEEAGTCRHCFRPLAFAVVLAAMLTGWGLISSWQDDGHYLSCRNFLMQVGDDVRYAPLGYFQQQFKFWRVDWSGRPIYAAIGLDSRGGSKISYCTDMGAWALSALSADPCDWSARATSDEFDVMNVPFSQWQVALDDDAKNAANGTDEEVKGVLFEHFALRCDDCGRTDVSSHGGTCNWGGTCSHVECVCHKGWFGLNCQYRDACPEIEVTAVGNGGQEEWAGMYRPLYGDDNTSFAVLNEHAIYTANSGAGQHLVVVFDGRRWLFTTARHLTNNATSHVSRETLARYLATSFRPHWETTEPPWVSSTVDITRHVPDRPDPTGADVRWYRPRGFGPNVHGKLSGTNLIPEPTTWCDCAVCDAVLHPCHNGGACGRDGACSCPSGYYGPLCQVAGFGMCRALRVSVVNDGLSEELAAAIGGAYVRSSSRTVGHRPVYVAPNGQMTLVYCLEGMYWALTGTGDTEEPCTLWRAKSSRSSAYHILLAKSWTIRESVSGNATATSDSSSSPLGISCSDT